ncbi:ABC transporter ATP-binding protein, partial [Francisella noatunensis subsp. orientalis]|nr:ABC transporter ATP-binding protein [Francisella orientalis]
ISDRLFVMYLGSLVEVSPKQSIYNNPVHLYTKVLLNVIPIADPQLARQRTIEIEKSDPSLISIKDDVYVACHNI